MKINNEEIILVWLFIASFMMITSVAACTDKRTALRYGQDYKPDQLLQLSEESTELISKWVIK